jgi:hypothetical protein
VFIVVVDHMIVSSRETNRDDFGVYTTLLCTVNLYQTIVFIESVVAIKRMNTSKT